MVQDYGFRLYNPSIGKFLSVDPLASSYPWNSIYSFAENDVIRNVDLDGAESDEVINFVRELKVKPQIGVTTVILSPKSTMVYPSGTSPAPICCDVQFRKEIRYKYEEVGGLNGYNQVIVQDSESLELPKVVDNFTSVAVNYSLDQGQRYLNESNVELASSFGPSLITGLWAGSKIFRNGKFTSKFLNTLSAMPDWLAYGRKFSLKIPLTGFKHLGVKERFVKATKAIQNVINKNILSKDVAGVIKDIHGKPSSGQHYKEFVESLSGLRNSVKELEKQLSGGELSGEAHKAAKTAISEANNAIEFMQEVIETAGKSFKKH